MKKQIVSTKSKNKVHVFSTGFGDKELAKVYACCKKTQRWGNDERPPRGE